MKTATNIFFVFVAVYAKEKRSMYKITIFGSMASGKSTLANALVDDCTTNMRYRFTSELTLANKMVFGASDGFRVYPTREAAEHGLGVMTIEENSQLDFFRNIRTGILGYTDKDIAFVETEHPSKLMNLGVEIIELPFLTTDNYRQIFDFLTDADLIIYCINSCHVEVDSNGHISFLEHLEAPVLFALTHFDYYRLEEELGNNRWNEIQEVFSSRLRTLYSKFNDRHLFLLDPYLYIHGLEANDMELIDRSRFLYLKAEIYRLVARAYYDRL